MPGAFFFVTIQLAFAKSFEANDRKIQMPIRHVFSYMDPRLRGEDEKRRVLSDRGHKAKMDS